MLLFNEGQKPKGLERVKRRKRKFISKMEYNELKHTSGFV